MSLFARRLRRLEQAQRIDLPWNLPLREWSEEQQAELWDMNRRGLRIEEGRDLVLHDIATDPDPERVDRGRI